MFGNTFDGVFRNTYIVDPDGRIEAVYEGSPRRATPTRYWRISNRSTSHTEEAACELAESRSPPSLSTGDRVQGSESVLTSAGRQQKYTQNL